MTREQLIEIIFNDTSNNSCPEYSCEMPELEGNTGDCCKRCAEKQLADYEGKILARDILKKPQIGCWYFCPNCSKIMEYQEFSFCPKCGQRLDWED